MTECMKPVRPTAKTRYSGLCLTSAKTDLLTISHNRLAAVARSTPAVLFGHEILSIGWHVKSNRPVLVTVVPTSITRTAGLLMANASVVEVRVASVRSLPSQGVHSLPCRLGVYFPLKQGRDGPGDLLQ